MSEQSSASSGETRKGECPACNVKDVPLRNVNDIYICDKCASKRFSSKVRKSIEEAFERQQAQRQREAWRKRIELTRKGVAYYDEAKYQDALRVFREYIGILETHQNAPPGGLSPLHFDTKKEAGEILLVTGVYWDMVKIYDRMKGKQAELRQALNKYYEFSVDRPHLILASEALRRYLNSGNCVHKEDFKNTHRLLRAKLAKCFIAGAVYGPTSPEVVSLRMFRDEIMGKSFLGRAFIRFYYGASPSVACMVARSPRAQKLIKRALDPVAAIAQRMTVPMRDGRK